MSPKETGEGYIPTVSKATVKTFYADAKADPVAYEKRLEELKTRLMDENFELARHIVSELKRYPDHLQPDIFASIVSTLLIIEKQARANRLSATFTTVESSDTQNS